MTPALIRRLTVDPTLDWLAGVSIPSGRGARRLVLAIGAQESGFTSRVQAPVAHAKGFWQFEAGGGVRGVLSHPNTQKEALAACAALVVPATVNGIWMARRSDCWPDQSDWTTPRSDCLAAPPWARRTMPMTVFLLSPTSRAICR